MTLDRDIRFTPEQITVTQYALRDEIKRRRRSIEKAEAAKAAGQKIQWGRLDEHHRALAAAKQALENLEAARRQIGQLFATKLG